MAKLKRIKLTDSQKNLLREGLLAAVIFCLLLAIALGWFSSNKEVGAGGIQLSAQANDVTAELYRLKGAPADPSSNESWEKVDNIEIANYLPGASRTYKIVLTNQSTVTVHTCSVTLVGFGYTVNLNNDPTGANQNPNDPLNPSTYKGLENVIILSELTAIGGNPSFTAETKKELSYYWKGTPDDSRNLILAQGITVPKKQESQTEGANTATIQFTFLLPGETTDNYHQNQKLTFDKIEIVTS